MYTLYWGDLHSHCSISYGHGTVAQALLRAQDQLDFCSITGHAFWPDMPTDRERYGQIIDYHNTGFSRLARNWPTLLEQQAAASRPGQFIVFPSYEWHSRQYGDHNVYGIGPELTLRDAAHLHQLREIVKRDGGIAVPHHIGYAAGYRGIDWRHFREEISPFVEIFSLHGCSLSEQAPYPMLHDMGPRDFGSTAEAGWQRGHRFGIVGGTDHHGAYPGSHGDGRMGVFAQELTRESLWEAFLARRVFAATGDRIDARLFVDDAWIGSAITSAGRRHIRIVVQGSDALDRVELFKNGRVVRRSFPQPSERRLWTGGSRDASPQRAVVGGRYRLRITWGWGRKEEIVRWAGRLTITDGELIDVETCFSGQPIVAPRPQTGDEQIPDDEDRPHQVIERSARQCVWQSVTTGNPTMRHETTQAISFGVVLKPAARITVEVNGRRYVHTAAELLGAGRSHYLRGWLSEAVRIGPLVPFEECCIETEFVDEPECPVDMYRLEVAQKNGQWAWLSPIWVER